MDAYLELLGLNKNFTASELKKAYRTEMAKYHPDRVEHLGEEFKTLAEERAKEINQAYNYLKEYLGNRA